MIVVRCISVVVILGFLAGCGSSHQAGGELTEEATTLQEVNDLLHIAASSGHPPAKLSDLDRHKALFPRAYDAVKSGQVVVLWGTPPKGEGEVGKDEVVIAYDKDVPTNGGHVLLSAGTVKKMSADEFKAAPKGGKK
jgi:hypothetical protein